ncbi:zf-U1-domain-containing protein [Meira miltonrushii]|uniref:Zf-U1-domain-containing protein n=1 Tax=Meira miltonrushii TaxID=1280837 RepID=A0A316VE80_9BASI|nr:zf-U1-domain-containing protein [Meira miltonrushii]PWN35604.1 zf-U1-domain-containing protein [Meira miltonrushii]
MGKHYCYYCDVHLTHDSTSVRKAHNTGRNHLQNVRDYYQSLDPAQNEAIFAGVLHQYDLMRLPHPQLVYNPPNTGGGGHRGGFGGGGRGRGGFNQGGYGRPPPRDSGGFGGYNRPPPSQYGNANGHNYGEPPTGPGGQYGQPHSNMNGRGPPPYMGGGQQSYGGRPPPNFNGPPPGYGGR